MKKHRRIEQDGLIVTHFGGPHSLKDANKSLAELLEINGNEDHIYEIVINEDDIQLNFTNSEREHLNDKVKFTYEQFSRGALAIVAKQDLVFGLSRMMQMTIENEQIAVSVFRSEELARQWIQEIRILHSKAPLYDPS